jgi:hypothetical protein
MLSRQHFDVQIPMDAPTTAEADPNYNRGKYLFCNECVWPLLDVALASSGRTTYASVLRMDKKIRDWRLPLKAQVANYVPTEEQKKGFAIQRNVTFVIREITLLALHR